MRILIIAGGKSGEREVSLRSGSAIKTALLSTGHQADLFDPKERRITHDLAHQYDVAFPIVHGQGGEDGSLQSQLDEIGLKYVGSSVDACRLTFDKFEYKQILESNGISTPEGIRVHEQDVPNNKLFRKPFVLKPYDGGSSVDTFIVRDTSTAPWDAFSDALKRYGEMLLEELVEGIEITVGVLADGALPVVEIIPPANGEFDYENKYNGATQELCPPKNVPSHIQTQAQQLALQIHKLTDCRHFSRTDMIIRPDNSLVVLETNTLPGMTDQSLFPKSAAVAGYTMPQLVEKLIQLATTKQ